jgi:hypothetical protein
MRWILRKVVGIVILAACFGVVAMAHAQHADRYFYEKLEEMERHIDNTDKAVKDNAQDCDKDSRQNEKDIIAVREQIEEYKDYALGFGGCFTLFVGFLKYLGRKGDQSA